MKAKSAQSSKPLPRGRRPLVSVTDMDIETAMPKKSGHCMVADAVKRAFPEVTNVIVDMQTIRWSDKRKGLRYTYFTPARVMAILIAWDQGIKPKPFSFRLRGPHITTMRTELPKKSGKRKRKLVHKLGKRKRHASKAKRARSRAAEGETTIGGKPRPLLSRQDRIFGSRQFSHLIAADELKKIQALVQD